MYLQIGMNYKILPDADIWDRGGAGHRQGRCHHQGRHKHLKTGRNWRCWKETGDAGDALNTGEAGWGSWKVCCGQSSAPLKDTELL